MCTTDSFSSEDSQPTIVEAHFLPQQLFERHYCLKDMAGVTKLVGIVADCSASLNMKVLVSVNQHCNSSDRVLLRRE